MATETLADAGIGCVTSRDGTTIGYRRVGRGRAVVLLHGAMESSLSHIQLAEALAPDFTVYLPDRRGRGLSGPYTDDYSIQKDVEDMDALITNVGAHDVFGISAGAVIWLQAALALPAIRRAAIYEPPLSLTPAAATAILMRFDEEMAQGKVSAALVTGMLGARMGPAIFNFMPRWLLESLTNIAMSMEDKRAKKGDVTMRMLAPTLHHDFAMVAEMSQRLDSFAGVNAEVLLLGGSKSPAYLKAALDGLEKVLPNVRRVEFPGLGHSGSGNTDRGGRPDVVANELRRFFA
jgi:pimeloyl-ACP methyl ester carboxylesterase